MNIQTQYMTRNDCYKAGGTIIPKGIMLHSTATPGVMAKDWFSRWNRSYSSGEISVQVCTHAFVDDQDVWQYLPWTHRGWHAGGKANDTHIGIELCEPSGFSYAGGATMVGYDVAKQEPYFRNVWEKAVDLCVTLCREYGLTEQQILCHSEGYAQGLSSNHADVMHWFPQHEESMDSFRLAVKRALEGQDVGIRFAVGDVVAFTENASEYVPGGCRIPEWVKQVQGHVITQIGFQGAPVIQGGRTCVLLGKRMDMTTGSISDGILTWVDQTLLTRIDSSFITNESSTPSSITYRVQVGAFTNREQAESVQERLFAAGFEATVIPHLP